MFVKYYNQSVSPFKLAYILREQTDGHLKIDRICVSRNGGIGSNRFDLNTNLPDIRGWLFEDQEKFTKNTKFELLSFVNTIIPSSLSHIMTLTIKIDKNPISYQLELSPEIVEDLKRTLKVSGADIDTIILQEVVNVYHKIEYVQGGYLDPEGNFHKN